MVSVLQSRLIELLDILSLDYLSHTFPILVCPFFAAKFPTTVVKVVTYSIGSKGIGLIAMEIGSSPVWV